MNIRDYLERIWLLQQNHFFLFFFASFVTTLIGISLATLKDSKFNKLVLNFHVIPLFLAPVLISKIFIDFLSANYSMTVRQSQWILAVLGILFHSWLAYFILSNLFNFQKRVQDFISIVTSTRNIGLKKNAIGFVLVLKFARPVIMTWAIIYVFFESMVSPCAFSDTPVCTIIFAMIDSGKTMGNSLLKPELAITTLTLFGTVISLSYFISILIEKRIIHQISDYNKRLSRKSKSLNWFLIIKIAKQGVIF